MKTITVQYQPVFATKPKLVIAECFQMEPWETPDIILWTERGEDYYGLTHYKGKKVAIVTRRNWLKAKDIPEDIHE